MYTYIYIYIWCPAPTYLPFYAFLSVETLVLPMFCEGALAKLISGASSPWFGDLGFYGFYWSCQCCLLLGLKKMVLPMFCEGTLAKTLVLPMFCEGALAKTLVLPMFCEGALAKTLVLPMFSFPRSRKHWQNQ